jgi:Protein of unknown function (DUF3047)
MDFHERYRGLVDKLRGQRPGAVRDAAVLHLPARLPPWTDTGLTVERGDRLTILAAGRVVWGGGLEAGPRYHLWGRIGDDPLFRLGTDTATLTAAGAGRLRLCIYHGTWATPDGTLATPIDAYAALQGGLDVLVIRWHAGFPAERGLAELASLAPSDPLLAEEGARAAAARRLPDGFEPLWFLGHSEIFHRAESEGAPIVALRADANAGIVRRPVELPLKPGTSLEWTWRINAPPSRVAEDSFATHDYTSVALEFDDGRDLTWYWSASLPAGHHYACPLPRWRGKEWHTVTRSGPAGLGTWVDERADVHADAARALGNVPARIVAVWLIAVSLFQRTQASTDFRRIALIQDGRPHVLAP